MSTSHSPHSVKLKTNDIEFNVPLVVLRMHFVLRLEIIADVRAVRLSAFQMVVRDELSSYANKHYDIESIAFCRRTGENST